MHTKDEQINYPFRSFFVDNTNTTIGEYFGSADERQSQFMNRHSSD